MGEAVGAAGGGNDGDDGDMGEAVGVAGSGGKGGDAGGGFIGGDGDGGDMGEAVGAKGGGIDGGDTGSSLPEPRSPVTSVSDSMRGSASSVGDSLSPCNGEDPSESCGVGCAAVASEIAAAMQRFIPTLGCVLLPVRAICETRVIGLSCAGEGRHNLWAPQKKRFPKIPKMGGVGSPTCHPVPVSVFHERVS